MDRRAWVLLWSLALIWGASYLFIKLGLEDLEPVFLVFARLDAHLDELPQTLGAAAEDAQWQARRIVEDLAIAFQASLLVRTGPPAVADAFCAGRLGEARGRAFGTLPRGVDGAGIVGRVLP